MQTLKRNEQLMLAHAILRRWHSDAATALGESSSVEKEALLWRHDNFFRMRGFWQRMPQFKEKYQHVAAAQYHFQNVLRDLAKIIGEACFVDDNSLNARLDDLFRNVPSPLEDQIVARKHAGEKIKFASKRKLLRLMATKFASAFGDQCVGSDRQLDGDPFLYFERKCCGWIIRTDFWFGRGETVLECSHTISSEVVVEHRFPDASDRYCFKHLALDRNIYNTVWESLLPEDLESACDAAIKYCAHFFEVLPKLLKGLEYEKIAKELHIVT
jgi:hypothetical protein